MEGFLVTKETCIVIRCIPQINDMQTLAKTFQIQIQERGWAGGSGKDLKETMKKKKAKKKRNRPKTTTKIAVQS